MPAGRETLNYSITPVDLTAGSGAGGINRYRSAILGQPMHTYVPLPQMGLWLNMFLLPLTSDRENTGYCVYIYDAVKIKETLELTAFFLAAEIANYLLLRRLEVLSSVDMLTGVRNRNRMNAMVGDIRNGRITLPTPVPFIP